MGFRGSGDSSILGSVCSKHMFVAGPRRRSLGILLVLADWRMKVFWSSGIVDIPSDRIYIRTIPLPGCMKRCSNYTPFSYQTWLAWHRKTCALAASPEELSPYGSPRQGPPEPWYFSDDWTAWDAPQTKIVPSKDW